MLRRRSTVISCGIVRLISASGIRGVPHIFRRFSTTSSSLHHLPDTSAPPSAGIAIILAATVPEWHGTAAGTRTLGVIRALKSLGYVSISQSSYCTSSLTSRMYLIHGSSFTHLYATIYTFPVSVWSSESQVKCTLVSSPTSMSCSR